LNTANFDKCLDGGEMATRVNTDLNEGTTAGVEGTPATFVNGMLVSGAVPYSELKAAIQAALQ
jgi:protein-disulfide isomerase